MELKKCPKCDKNKKLDEFSKNNKNKKIGLASWCKYCVKQRSKECYNNNKEKYYFKSRELKIKLRDWLNNIKSNYICKKCGENRIYVLDFHHLDPNKKEFGISQMVKNYKQKETILKEIEKCICLCKNCHSEFHYLEKEKGITIEEYLNNPL